MKKLVESSDVVNEAGSKRNGSKERCGHSSMAKRPKTISVFSQKSTVSSTVLSITDRDHLISYVMTPSREADIKSMTRGNWKAVTSRTMKNHKCTVFVIIECVGRVLKHKLSKCCSDSHTSVLQTRDSHCLKDFTWNSLLTEANTCTISA